MEPDSFFISCQSNKQTELFPDNVNYAFRNTIPVGINLQNYKVGLESIYFTDFYEKPIYKPHILEEEPKVATKFFQKESLDNKISVQSEQEGQIAVIKFSDKFDVFLVQLNTVLKTHKYPIHVAVELNGPVVTRIVLINNGLSHITYTMNRDLARIFGYSNTLIPPGESKSDLSFNINLFNGYEKDSTLGFIQFFIYRQHEYELSQLDERPTLSELLVYITSLLNTDNLDVSMTKVYGRDAIEYEIKPYYKRVIFSKFLNNYLGLPETFTFKGTGTAKVGAGLEDFEEVEQFDFDYTKVSSSKLFICCDIIDPNYYAGVPLPYLAIVDRQNVKEQQVAYQPQRITYKQINCDFPNQLSISIKTDQNDFLVLSKYPTIVNLHLKKNTLA